MRANNARDSAASADGYTFVGMARSAFRRPQRTHSPIGLRVRERRSLLGLTQPQLAERTGLSVAHINMIEGGERRNLKAPTLKRLAEGLECTVDQLLEGLDAAEGSAAPTAPELDAFLLAAKKDEGITKDEEAELRRVYQALGLRPSPAVFRRLLDLIRTEMRSR